MESKVRVRFAPSPTGPLHIGGVRTALYNYLFAKKHGGEFLLRIEDTDSNRFVPGAEEYIVETFRWLGLDFDEGVHIGGPKGPYRQSERKEIYKKHVDYLLNNNLAYYAFDTAEELEAMRKRLEEEKSNSLQYDASTRMQMKNSLSLSSEEVKTRLNNNEAYVIRIKIEAGKEIHVHDLIRGKVVVNSSTIDDKVLYKSSDGLPTYHLANIVDDHLMEISHVIRGEEWLPSAPLHVLLYQYFGWTESMPKFAHLPLLLKPDGNGKLSKRDGDRLGFPVFPLQWKDPKTGETSAGYRENGYYPEAVLNILAFLGWNPGTEQEIFSKEELAAIFSLERVSKSGAKFNVEKARWFNHQYLQADSEQNLVSFLLEILKEKNLDKPENKKLEKIIHLVKERLHFPNELWNQTFFFFEAPKSYDEKVVKKRWNPEIAKELDSFSKELLKISFDTETLEKIIKEYIEEKQLNTGAFMNALRLCLVGTSMGPHIYDIMEIIGKEESILRIQNAIKKI